jgi:hypothetical protein
MIYLSNVVTLEVANVADDNESMQKFISRISGGYLIVVVLSVFISWKYDDIVGHIAEISEIDISGVTVAVLLTIVASISGFIFIHFEIHKSIDSLVFGALRDTNQYICGSIRRESEITLGRPVSATDNELMNLFYSFVNRRDEVWPALWNRSFEVWKHYWTAMNLFGVSVVGAIIEALLMILDSPHPSLSFVILVVLVLFSLFVWYNSRYHWRPKLIDSIAEPQLVMMTKDQRAEFDKKVRDRFGGQTL